MRYTPSTHISMMNKCPSARNTRATPENRMNSQAYFEKYAWLFMRFSGVALVFLALGHLFIMLMWEDGVYRIDFNYVAERWASPFWQIWDMALLWLAMVHGANGMRTIIGDYARKNITRFYLNSLLLLATGFTVVLGTYVLVTFDANIS